MKQRQSNSGFTLLELTCALFIITTAGFGAIQLYSVGIDKILTMREFDVATEVLRNEMEQLRALPFAAVKSQEAVEDSSPARDSLHKATTRIDVSPVEAGLKEVTVTMRWQSRHGRWVTRSLVTYRVNKGARP